MLSYSCSGILPSIYMTRVRNTTLTPIIPPTIVMLKAPRPVPDKKQKSIPPDRYDSHIFGETPGGPHESPEPLAFPCRVSDVFGQGIQYKTFEEGRGILILILTRYVTGKMST